MQSADGLSPGVEVRSCKRASVRFEGLRSDYVDARGETGNGVAMQAIPMWLIQWLAHQGLELPKIHWTGKYLESLLRGPRKINAGQAA